MRKIIEAKALPDKIIYAKYSNGMEGKVSLKKLTTREQYEELERIDVFEDVIIDEKSGDIIVNGNIELCKNALYGILDLKKQMSNLGLLMGD